MAYGQSYNISDKVRAQTNKKEAAAVAAARDLDNRAPAIVAVCGAVTRMKCAYCKRHVARKMRLRHAVLCKYKPTQ